VSRLTCFGRVFLPDLFALGRRRPPLDVHVLHRRRVAVHGAMELLEEGWRSLKLLRNATGIRAFSASTAFVLLANGNTFTPPSITDVVKEICIRSNELQATRSNRAQLEVSQSAISKRKARYGHPQLLTCDRTILRPVSIAHLYLHAHKTTQYRPQSDICQSNSSAPRLPRHLQYQLATISFKFTATTAVAMLNTRLPLASEELSKLQ